MPKPRIAVTMGDPAGVGPELCLRVLRSAKLRRLCEIIIYGNTSVLHRVAKRLQQPFDESKCHQIGATPTVKPGRVSAACGLASFQYVDAALTAATSGTVAAVCTMPINKEAWALAGINYPGHTELFAERVNSPKWCMMLTGPGITCSLVTIHIGYAEVPNLLTTAGIIDVIELTAAAVKRMTGRTARLGVCGLNPHAGEGGLFGHGEEVRIIAPAIAAMKARGFRVAGPLPPDTAFTPEQRKRYDAYICMYHDQGLIPLKALAFDQGVNVTLGLPFSRTSPDHGTAFDIAWKGVAKADSAIRAIELAAQMRR